MDRGAWWAIVQGVTKSLTGLSLCVHAHTHTHTHTHTHIHTQGKRSTVTKRVESDRLVDSDKASQLFHSQGPITCNIHYINMLRLSTVLRAF